jgi:hypothetical protein
MERSEIRVSIDAARSLPDFAVLHPGYLLRMSEMPEIDTQLMPTDNPAKGIGEASLPLVAPCVGNALFKLTGKRFRALPMWPERVKRLPGFDAWRHCEERNA